MDVSIHTGEVYFLDQNMVSIYGTTGIELRLVRRNLDQIEKLISSRRPIQDRDAKDRRYSASYCQRSDSITFEPKNGEKVIVQAHHFIREDIRKAA